MKKFYILLAVSIISLGAFAQGPTLEISQAGTLPVIDGVVDGVWNEVDEVDIEVDVVDDFGTASIAEGWFKMMWTEDTLYILMRRSDDDFATTHETGIDNWMSDRDELFFDVHTDTLEDGRGASDTQSGASYGHYQFTSDWADNADGDAIEPIHVENKTQWYHNAMSRYAYVVEDNAYHTEWAIPWDQLTVDTAYVPNAPDSVFIAEAGAIFGCEMVISDVDMSDNPTDDSFRKFLRWADISGWDNMDGAGVVTLGSGVVTGPNAITAASVSNVSVYPSPAANNIAISNLEGTFDVDIFNVVGTKVLSISKVTADQQIDISSLSAGVYIVVADDVAARIIKE